MCNGKADCDPCDPHLVLRPPSQNPPKVPACIVNMQHISVRLARLVISTVLRRTLASICLSVV